MMNIARQKLAERVLDDQCEEEEPLLLRPELLSGKGEISQVATSSLL
jgi:hypothetical protein